jgi:putative transcriptional regulator
MAGGGKAARRLTAYVGITEQNLSLLKSGKVKGIRFATLGKICERLACQPGDITEWVADTESSMEEDTGADF